MKLFEELKWRGLIDNISHAELEEKLNEGGLTFYMGTDPSADSLHIGHLCFFLMSKRLANHGHNPILLVGGATGSIGDPRPTSERPMMTKEQLDYNYQKLSAQVKKLFDFEIVNNYDWCKEINFIDYLRDFGKYFGINYMLAKEVVKSRLETGITYTEFSYMIMQALDYEYLFKTRNVTLQLGGSDQWGNITAGIELIRKKQSKEVYALSIPLITKADGTKFGKSEGGAIWLDKEKTSSYEIYQFLINSEDSKVIDYLKKFTFLTREEIDVLEISLQTEPHLRLAHKKLAEEVITFLHGTEEYEKAILISETLFSGKLQELSKEDLSDALKGMDTFSPKLGFPLVDFLVNHQIFASKRQARDMIGSGALMINGIKMSDENEFIDETHLLYEKYLVVRKGKKKYFVGEIN